MSARRTKAASPWASSAWWRSIAEAMDRGRFQRRVGVGVAGGGGEPVRGALDGDGVQAEALGRRVPRLAALEELEGLRGGDERLDGLRGEHLDGGDDALDLTAAGAVGVVGQAQHGDDERDVGLDGLDHLAGGGALLGDEREHPVARLGERGEQLQRLERGGEALAVTLVARGPDEGVGLPRRGRRGGARLHRGLGGGEGRRHELFIGHGWGIERDAWTYCLRLPSAPIGRHGRTVEHLLLSRVVYQLTRRPSSAESMRASARSRPMSATVSKIPGEIVVPVSATRSGWKIAFALRPERSTASRSAASTVSVPQGSGTRSSASRATVSASAPASGSRNFSRAAGSSTGSSKKARASGQNSSSVEIFSCVTVTASPRPVRFSSASSRAVRSATGSSRT